MGPKGDTQTNYLTIYEQMKGFRESMVQVVCILSRMRCLNCILSLLDWSPLMVDGQSSQICEWMTLLLRWERPLMLLYRFDDDWLRRGSSICFQRCSNRRSIEAAFRRRQRDTSGWSLAMPFGMHVVVYQEYLLYQFDDDWLKTARSRTFVSRRRR